MTLVLLRARPSLRFPTRHQRNASLPLVAALVAAASVTCRQLCRRRQLLPPWRKVVEIRNDSRIFLYPGIPTTIKTLDVNITTIAYLRVLIIGIGSTIFLWWWKPRGMIDMIRDYLKPKGATPPWQAEIDLLLFFRVTVKHRTDIRGRETSVVVLD